ncbi:formate/nitrite transporter family protein [Peribacillus sp. NPDC096379]|uniref:formate/nitrite transporter family protein n=1 Tax=Peribacillus sp. NPDC096379 TaxID=3364393 RepID=UPI00380E5E83
MIMYSPEKTYRMVVKTGYKKVKKTLSEKLILGFMGGLFISLGYLLDIRVIAGLSDQWGTFSNFIGGAVFPVGLICILLVGGELITSNMLVIPVALFEKRVNFLQLMNNWFCITLSNLAGALFVAYFFGHVVGLTDTEPFLSKTIHIAEVKVGDSFWVAFISGIGCNIFVCVAVWLCFSAKSFSGKVLGIWLPIMSFVSIGFQHVVANMFIIPAAIFAGYLTWMDFLMNFISVFLGNVVGGIIFIGLAYNSVQKGTNNKAEKKCTKTISR